MIVVEPDDVEYPIGVSTKADHDGIEIRQTVHGYVVHVIGSRGHTCPRRIHRDRMNAFLINIKMITIKIVLIQN